VSEVLIFAPGAARLRALIGPLPAGVTAAVADGIDAAMAQAAEASVLVAMPFAMTRELVAAMPRLAWVQAMTAGVDALAPLELDPNITVTTARGIHGPQISELIFLHMLAFTRDLRGILARQAARAWAPSPQPLLSGRRLVVLGIGAIAEALAARAQAFGMHVTGVSGSRDTAPGFDRVLPITALRDAAAEADFLVVLTPLTPRTEGIVDATIIAALPETAVLINVARGKVVDEAALISALAAKRIRGAGLDVFATEPLPTDSPLWAMENVFVTPHVAGWSDVFAEQIAPVVADNLARWFAEPRRPLNNLARP
jgi:phosphoglycerate dehydrogenase-like enzyme